MRQFASSSASILLSSAIFLAVSVSSQSRSPDGSSSPNETKGPAPDIKVSSRLVVVDVVVRKSNHPVSGLGPHDFAIYEDGKEQTIHDFSAHFAADHPEAAAPLPALPPDTYTNQPEPNVNDSATVLLLDGLNTQPSDVQYVRREMISYLKKAPAGRRIAVFALGHKLRMLQGFTTDSSRLMAALEKANATSPASLLPDEAFEHEESALLDSPGVSADDLTNASNGEAEFAASQLDMRVGSTVEAMQQLTRYLAGEPGRKNLVWFSGSFPADFVSVARLVAGTQAPSIRMLDQQVQETADMLAVARVAVYPVEVRGVLLMPMGATASFVPTYGRTGPNGNPSAPATQEAFLQRAAEQATMESLAQETGGRAVHDSNDLQGAMADALDDGSSFYTIAYVPTNTNYNGAQRNIQVHLAHEKADLFYRHSYYADAAMFSEGHPSKDTRTVFLDSMQPGVPNASQILFSVHVAAADRAPAAGKIAGANIALKKPALRYSVDYAALLETIRLTQNAPGAWQGHVAALAIAYDGDGNRLNWAVNDLPLNLDQASRDAAARSGLQIHQILDLPAGDVYLLVGLYDPNSGRFGTFEVPLHVPASR